MKIIFIFLFSVGLLFGAEGTKGDVDMENLFKQLDTVISSKKDDKKIKKEKTVHQEKSSVQREKNYKAFNEASKKYHIFRAEKILKTVQELKQTYIKRSKQSIYVQRYSVIGNKKFAYASSKELQNTIKSLKADGETLKKLKNFEKLLKTIGQFDIKTIAKVLIIVEQEIMNLLDMGIKKVQVQAKRETSDTPVLIKSNSKFDNISVYSIDENNVVLQVDSF